MGQDIYRGGHLWKKTIGPKTSIQSSDPSARLFTERFLFHQYTQRLGKANCFHSSNETWKTQAVRASATISPLLSPSLPASFHHQSLVLGKGGALGTAWLPHSHLLYLRGKPHTLLSLDLTVISKFNCTVINLLQLLLWGKNWFYLVTHGYIQYWLQFAAASTTPLG